MNIPGPPNSRPEIRPMRHELPRLHVEINIAELWPHDESIADCVRETILDETKKMIRDWIRSDDEFKMRLGKAITDASKRLITIVEGR